MTKIHIFFDKYQNHILKGIVLQREKYYVEVLSLKSNIDILIKQSGYKKKHIAETIGITPTQLSNWIATRSYPPLDKAFMLADVLGCKVDDLYDRKGEPQ